MPPGLRAMPLLSSRQLRATVWRAPQVSEPGLGPSLARGGKPCGVAEERGATPGRWPGTWGRLSGPGHVDHSFVWVSIIKVHFLLDESHGTWAK